jgi:hypothetical protein
VPKFPFTKFNELSKVPVPVLFQQSAVKKNALIINLGTSTNLVGEEVVDRHLLYYTPFELDLSPAALKQPPPEPLAKVAYKNLSAVSLCNSPQQSKKQNY